MPDLTPPPELVLEWLKERYCALPVLVTKPSDSALHVATQAARWGADQELEACCEILRALEQLPEDPAVTPAADDPAPTATPGEQYHEGMGDVTWWRFPVEEPPWVGSPNDSDWPGYHTHFTPLPPVPVEPDPAPTADVGEPLWRLMQKAHDKAATNRGGYAAEMRVVAGELQRHWEAKYGTVHSVVDEVLDWLRAEADRAESQT